MELTEFQVACNAVLITEPNLDPPGPRIVYANAAFQRMTGYGWEELRGKTPRILQGEKTDRRVLDNMRAVLQSGKPFFGETINYRKDRSEFRLRWHVDPLRDDSGDIIYWVAVQQEIHGPVIGTPTTSGDSISISELVAGITHQLTQPLYAIQNFADGLEELLRTSTQDPQLLEYSGQICKQSNRAIDLIYSLRNITNPKLGSCQRVNASDIVDAALEEVRDLFGRLDVQCDLVAPHPSPQVNVDPVQVQQVLTNLITNACEAMIQLPADERKLVVTTAFSEGDVVISIRDFGSGIDPLVADRLFDALETTKREPNTHHMGMGLAVCWLIVARHKGRIWFESTVPGTTFHVSLPVAT